MKILMRKEKWEKEAADERSEHESQESLSKRSCERFERLNNRAQAVVKHNQFYSMH